MAFLCHIIIYLQGSPISYKEKSCNKGTLYQCNCKSCWKEFEIQNMTEKYINWVQIELINCPNQQEEKTFDDTLIRKKISNWINEECALVLDCLKIGITKRITEKDVVIGGSIECTPLGGQVKINVIGKENHLTKENVIPSEVLVQILQAREHLLSYIIGIDLMSISTLSNNKIFSHQIDDLSEIHFDMFEDNKNDDDDDENYENEDEYNEEDEDYNHDDIIDNIQKIDLNDNHHENDTSFNEKDIFISSNTTILPELFTTFYIPSTLTSLTKQIIKENEIVTTTSLSPTTIQNISTYFKTENITNNKVSNDTLYSNTKENFDETSDDLTNHNIKIDTNKPSSTLSFNNLSIDIPEWLTIPLITILTALLLIICIISYITCMFFNCRTNFRKIPKDKSNKSIITMRQEQKNDITRLEENNNVEKMLLNKVGTGNS
ncbi:Hypothetical protein SRAE_1000128900 [Strongyloides ratti]|uniref:Uncharacterized protein n=1 Tax=Strongyloides ratti TaxID=34506 RepID=A0A090MVP0_STRRB|nr:Hypothetical protein SRAE_1000128900 [Strongyloides ratti]CEF63023.1 Hypothetical protein SRAE_1000128900 [Strongyloides ratti]